MSTSDALPVKLRVIICIQYVVNRMAGWIRRNSADPVEAELTDTMRNRHCIQDLITNFTVIRKEILDNFNHLTPIEGDLFFERTITDDGKWNKFYLKWYNKPSARARALFPATVDLIQRHPDIHLAMVSCLEPGAVIKPHRGVWNGSVRVHLGIEIPKDRKCYIRVDDRRYRWEEGNILAFDDTYMHLVMNKTDDPRIVLFLDVERRMRTAFHQAIVRGFNKTVARITTRD